MLNASRKYLLTYRFRVCGNRKMIDMRATSFKHSLLFLIVSRRRGCLYVMTVRVFEAKYPGN